MGSGDSNGNGQPAAVWPQSSVAGTLGNGRFAESRSRPNSVEELCQAVIEHVGRGEAIYAQGGGTALDFGNPPGRPGAAIETGSLCRVIDYPHADMTITVEAGVTGAQLHSVLSEHKQRLLVDIPEADRATLGGIFATGTCGPRRFGFGRPRDQIIGVSFVTSEGIVVKGGGRVVKNVAGYDFPKLLTGSFGTLGIITQMTLKVRPIPERSVIVWVPFEKLDDVSQALDRLNLSESRPVAIELLNGHGASAIGAGLPPGAWVLAIGLEDNAVSVGWQVGRLRGELGRADLAICEDDQAPPVWSALTEFQARARGDIVCNVAVPPSQVIALLKALDSESWAIQVHAGSGIIRLHSRREWELQAAKLEIERIRSIAAADGGSLVVVHCPSDWKSAISVWGPRRDDWILAEKIKRALDPGGVFNPGRFVGEI